jgi:hypothetical protein
MDAARTGWPVLVPDPNDLTDTSRWPVYTTAVTEQAGVGAIFALPMQRATINLGVLVLYRYKARIPGPRPAARRDGCCGHRRPDAAGAAHRPRPNPDSGGVQGWDGSWASRAEIHQATGMVLSQLGVSATDAFARSAPTPSPSKASWSRSPPTSCPPAAIHRMTVHRISTSGPRHRVSWREG